jgi:dTDP-4-amino-4,6-dideoxygalactose transaminase
VKGPEDNSVILALAKIPKAPLRYSERLSDLSGENVVWGIHSEAATRFHAERIVTVDPSRYGPTQTPLVTPVEFLNEFNDGCIGAVSLVPFLDLKAQHHQVYNEIDDKITDIIANTGFILGKYVSEFEEAFAGLHGVKHCLGVSSGTDALHVAMLSLGIGPGDEVVVPCNTFIATAEGVSLAGATPVFVDCDEYYNMNPEGLAKVLEERKSIKAIIPVHLYGQPAELDCILNLAEKHGVAVVEDACQAHCARYKDKPIGGFGSFSAFSFYPGKNLGAYGEAGAIMTNDDELFEKARMYRQHGEIKRYHHQVVGHNYRMSAFQGAVLSTKVKYITDWTGKRQRNAAIYGELLSDVPEVAVPQQAPGAQSVFHLYVIQHDRRDALQACLAEKSIGTGLHYPVPLHLQEAYSHLGYKKGDFPLAEEAAGRILSLPMYPELSKSQIEYVCDCVSEFSSRRVHTPFVLNSERGATWRRMPRA